MFPNVTVPVKLTVSQPHARLSDEAISAMARLVLGLANRPDLKLSTVPAPRITNALTQARSAS